VPGTIRIDQEMNPLDPRYTHLPTQQPTSDPTSEPLDSTTHAPFNIIGTSPAPSERFTRCERFFGEAQVLTQQSGDLSDGEGFYGVDDCRWIIQPAVRPMGIVLQFEYIDLEIGYDFVRVYDGTSISAPRLGEYTGYGPGVPMPREIEATSGTMLVVLNTDATVGNRGFLATYRSTEGTFPSTPAPSSTAPTTFLYQPRCVGLRVKTENAGMLSSWGDDLYSATTFCAWHLRPADSPPTIRLEFINLETEIGYDFVHVYDGSSARATLLGAFSGTERLPPPVVARSGEMYVTFTTDASINMRGFQAMFSTSGTMPAAPQQSPSVAVPSPTQSLVPPTAMSSGASLSSCAARTQRQQLLELLAPAGLVNDGPGRCCRPLLLPVLMQFEHILDMFTGMAQTSTVNGSCDLQACLP
jgi:hypothetical protein